MTRLSLSRSVVALTAALLAATASIVGATGAEAATCKGTTCDGKNPESYGCSADATNVGSITAPYYENYVGIGWYADSNYTMTLRYSKKCQAVWMRTVVGSASEIAYFREESCDTKCGTKYARVYATVDRNDENTLQWSVMVPHTTSTNHAHVCGRPTYDHGVNTNPRLTYGTEGCSGWDVL